MKYRLSSNQIKSNQIIYFHSLNNIHIIGIGIISPHQVVRMICPSMLWFQFFMDTKKLCILVLISQECPLQYVYCVLYKLEHTGPPLVRVRAGDYEKGTVPPRLGTVTSAFECQLINMKILPTKIIRSTFSLITSGALSAANIVVIFETIPWSHGYIYNSEESTENYEYLLEL
jgi:hypothetical protein